MFSEPEDNRAPEKNQSIINKAATRAYLNAQNLVGRLIEVRFLQIKQFQLLSRLPLPAASERVRILPPCSPNLPLSSEIARPFLNGSKYRAVAKDRHLFR